MKILILHRVPYHRIDYARGIDHLEHEVTYFGSSQLLDTLPADLPCDRVLREASRSVFEEARDWIYASRRVFDRVISMSEYELLDAARLREVLQLPGQSTDQVLLARDKVRMKKAVEQAGLRVPKFLSMKELAQNPKQASWTGKTVIKPRCGASSEDVLICANPARAVEALRAITNNSLRNYGVAYQIDEFEAEEYVNGPVLHFDGLISGGALVAITASEYIGTCLDYANGNPLGSVHIPLSAQAEMWAEQSLAAVGITDGSFHLEAIKTDQGLVFLEVGNRVGGADVVSTFERATGVHLPSEELKLAIGGRHQRQTTLHQSSPIWHGWFAFPGHSSTSLINRIDSNVNRFKTDRCVIEWRTLGEGRDLPKRISYSSGEIPLAGIVGFDNWRLTRDWIESLFKSAGSGENPNSVTTEGDNAQCGYVTADVDHVL